MLLLTVTEFRNNIAKYLQMAMTERIALKSKTGIIELTPSKDLHLNPSPSKDPYFDNPKNVEDIEIGLKQYSQGDYTQINSIDELKNILGL